MSKKPVVLMILDGYGLNDNCEHNAVCEGKTPVMDQLMSQCPFVKGQASGLAVGLPEGQMGNSEVGHLNMGAGRVVYQELTRITKSINDGDFFNVPEFLTAVENCKKNNSALHLFGLVSTGGVHSHLNHIYGLLELAKRNGLEKVYVHCFLDGRDTPPASGKDFVAGLEAKMKEIGVELTIENHGASEMSSIISSKNFAIKTGGYGITTSPVDAANYFYISETNNGHGKDLDSLAATMMSTEDPKEQLKIMNELEKRHLDEVAIYVPTHNGPNFKACRKGLANYGPMLFGLPYYNPNVWINVGWEKQN